MKFSQFIKTKQSIGCSNFSKWFNKYSEAADLTKEDFLCKDEPISGLTELYRPDLSDIELKPDETDEVRNCDVADILFKKNKITAVQLAFLHKNFAGSEEKVLIDEKMVSSAELLEAKAELYEMEFRHIDPASIEQEVFDKLDFKFIKENSILPVEINGDTLVVATCDPANVIGIEDAKAKVQMAVKVVMCCREDVLSVCDFFAEREKVDYCVDDIINGMTDVEVVQDVEKNFEDLEKMAGQSPVIKFVNYIISNAIREGASDIHIEPKSKFTKIRYRIDGILFEVMQAPLKMHPAIVSRIKIMSNLDISERRLPQDGKISVLVGGREIDLRVSILPTNCGEKTVIRVLDSKSILRNLTDLGMEQAAERAFSQQIVSPHGILLVTGPTGSGKSTTLYSALNQMDGEKMNISTVEDPVEYKLGFCNQVQINDNIGFSFASSLRSLLRQDPDIIMIGEIRDSATAQIAVQAALTGHLVLSTLHTNDAPSSITRLVNIGIDPYLIAASLNAVLAQRLVRKICPNCKEPYRVPKGMYDHIKKANIDPEKLFHGIGCDKCRGSGYIGRVGIYELLVIDDVFREMINQDSSASAMRQIFHKSGQANLFDDGMQKVQQGLTTIDEVLRVTEAYKG